MAAAKRKVDAAGLPMTDGLRQFQKAVTELKNKSQSRITALTALADNLYAEAMDVAGILVNEIMHAKVERLQPLVSVVDSILKKVGKDYKTHLSEGMPQAMMTAFAKSEPTMHDWLKRMVNVSWRKHDLLPVLVIDQLDIALNGGIPAGVQEQAPAPAAVPAAPQVPEQAPQAAPPGPPPPMKAPPPQKPAPAPAAQAQPDAPATQAPEAAAPQKAPATTQDSPEMVERRLSILSKIIERRSPGHDELREIMEVPQVRKAISMQQKGKRQAAMALLSEFKAELERKHSEAVAAVAAAAEAARPRDPRQAQAFKPMDPRQLDPRQQAAAQAEARPADPRQATRLADPRQADAAEPAAQDPEASAVGQAGADAAAGKRSAEADAASGPAKQQRVARAADVKAAAAAAATETAAEDVPVEEQSIVPARQVLHGLSSLGFSETWLRQFMEQMPTTKAKQAQEQKLEAPSVGRKVIGASGEQLVYVDELTHSEMLLLMQFIFMLEDKAKSSGIDLSQRIPHTFSYLQVEPAIDVMLKRLFGELPHQCDKTGLRFATQDRLKKHHDHLYRKKQTLQSKQQHGAEARGWMESIPEWVGNRDLIVGPALFRMGESADEAQKAKQEELSKMQAAAPEEEEDEFEGKKWICPFDARRSICPISGEALPRTWSAALNDWAFCDTVAVEIGEKLPLHFPPGGPSGPHGLSETAVLMKQSCFFSTPPSQQLEALRECCSVAAIDGGGPGQSAATAAEQRPKVAGSAAFTHAPRKMDSALAALAAPRPPARRFF